MCTLFANKTNKNYLQFFLFANSGLEMEDIFAKIIVFAFNLAIISAQCTTIVTTGGTQIPERCKFPFRFQGQAFQKCTTFGDNDNLEWCSVDIDDQGNHIPGQGRWGHCDTNSCSSKEETLQTISPPSISVKTEGTECITVIQSNMVACRNVYS